MMALYRAIAIYGTIYGTYNVHVIHGFGKSSVKTEAVASESV